MLNDITKNTKIKEVYQKRLQLLEAQKRDLASEKERLQSSLTMAEKEVENWRRNCDNEKHTADDLRREKELLLKNFQRINGEYFFIVRFVSIRRRRLRTIL